MRYSEVAGPEEPDLLGPGMAIDFPIDRAEGEEEHADVDEGATKASADVVASARAAIAARVGLLGMVAIGWCCSILSLLWFGSRLEAVGMDGADSSLDCITHHCIATPKHALTS